MKIEVNIDPKINSLVEKEILRDISEMSNSYTEAQKAELVERFIQSINKQVALINSKDLTNNIAFSKNFRSLLINANNRRTRKIFETITGKSLGKTIKEAEAAFVDYFGNFLSFNEERENELKTQQEAEKKNAMLDAEKEYFSSPLWEYEKIQKMSPIQKVTFKKALEKLWKFDGVVRSMKEQLLYDYDHSNVIGKQMTNHMWKWNRAKFNQMDGSEQRAYNAKLVAGRSYYVALQDDFIREISKVIYDALNLSDITDYKSLVS